VRRRRVEIPDEIVIAFDMHGMPRRGRAIPGRPVRGRREGGALGQEKRMTAQCVTNKMWAAPGAVRVVPGDSVEVAFSTVCRRAGAVCARAGPGPLVGRGPFTAAAIGRPGETGVRRAAPLPNRPRAAASLRGPAAGRSRRALTPKIPPAVAGGGAAPGLPLPLGAVRKVGPAQARRGPLRL